jgi:hypothetical protein
MPQAPGSPVAALGYFFGVLSARVERMSAARKLEEEAKAWEEKRRYLLATLGHRAIAAGLSAPEAGQVAPLEQRIKEMVKQQLALAGEQGQQIKSFEAREEELRRDVAEKEVALATLDEQLKALEAERKALNGEIDAAQKKQQAPSQEVVAKLEQTNAPYQDLKGRADASRQALASTRETLGNVTREKKKATTELEARMKTTGKELEGARAEITAPLSAIGQAALDKGFQPTLSEPFRASTLAMSTAAQARQARARQYRDQMGTIDKAKFNMGGMMVGGGFVVLIILLFILRSL